jgi:hypothetical protein
MKLTTITILLILLLCINSVYSQHYCKAEITFNNDKKLEGLVDLPYKYDKYILYKSDEDSRHRKIPSDSITKITMFSKDGKIYKLENVWMDKKYQQLVLLVVEGYTNLYYTGDGIYINKEHNLIPTSSYVSGKTQPEYYYYIKRKNERVVTMLAITSPSVTMFGKAKAFRKAAAEYFNDWPELVIRLNNKEFTEKDVEKVVKLYNQHMEAKWGFKKTGI